MHTPRLLSFNHAWRYFKMTLFVRICVHHDLTHCIQIFVYCKATSKMLLLYKAAFSMLLYVYMLRIDIFLLSEKRPANMYVCTAEEKK